MLSARNAKSSGKELFYKRWVPKVQRQRLREEHATYLSIRIIGGLLILLMFYLLINIGEIFQDVTIFGLVAILYGATLLTAGTGLIKFRKFARSIALFVLISFLVLPFTPLFSEDDKGAPLIIILEMAVLYYLLRKTELKIFIPASIEKPFFIHYKVSV
jgi:hypothetical protein